MPWIESHQSLARHRKTLEAVAILKVDRHKLIGHLQELWWWGLDNADSSGLVGHAAAEAIAAAAGWPLRDAKRFVETLRVVGFLDQTEQGYALHDWDDYTGRLSTQRALRKAANREAQRKHRERLLANGQQLSANGQHNGQHDVSTESAFPARVTGPDLTGPNRTGPDRTPTPLPPSEPSEGGVGLVTKRTKKTKPKTEVAVAACCPNFARTGEHWEQCDQAARDVQPQMS